MNGEENGKLDRLLDEMSEHRKEVKGHGAILARLDERTATTKDETKELRKRVSAVERKSTGYGAGAGGVAGGFVAGFLQWLTGGGASG